MNTTTAIETGAGSGAAQLQALVDNYNKHALELGDVNFQMEKTRGQLKLLGDKGVELLNTMANIAKAADDLKTKWSQESAGKSETVDSSTVVS